MDSKWFPRVGDQPASESAHETWSRRRFMQSGSLLGAAMLGAQSAHAAAALEAYAGACAVKAGGRLDFYVRDPGGSFTADTAATVTIVRISSLVDLTQFSAPIQVRNRAVPADAAVNGCQWPVSFSLTVPTSWRSGLYYAFFMGAVGSGCCVPFVVRPAVKTAGAAVLVQIPVLTAQAINPYGGYLYPPDLPDLHSVSFDRPFADRWNIGFDAWQPTLVRWLEYKNIATDFCTSIEMHADPAVLNGYQLFVTAGRDMYWSREMRARFDAFVAAGGNAAILGGHTCLFPARLEPSASAVPNRSLVSWLGRVPDPDPRPSYNTDRGWEYLTPPEPEAASLGMGTASFNLRADAALRAGILYQVKAAHWMFAGTGLKPGDSISSRGLVGEYVADPVCEEGSYVPNSPYLNGLNTGRPYAFWSFGTPRMVNIVARANALPASTNGNAVLPAVAIFSRGGGQGTVFNAGTSDWVLALRNELTRLQQGQAERITENVLRRLSGPHLESAEVRRIGLISTANRWMDTYELILDSQPRLQFLSASDAQYFVRIDTPVFKAYPQPAANTVPVVRFKYIKPGNEPERVRIRYSLRSALANGWQPDGVAFHAFAAVLPRTVPVYQHHKVGADGGWRFYYSLNLSEPGWTFDDLAWYAPVD